MQRCVHFGECGGCHTQDVPYAAQVAAKQAGLEALLADAWNASVPVVPSPVQWHYRNKIDPAFSPKQYEVAPPKDFERECVLGFKKKGRWFWPLETEECLIAPEGMRDLFAAVREWYRARNLRAFNSRTGEGRLRNLLVREGKRSRERMVVLITTPGEDLTEGFVETVQRAWPCESIQWGTSDSKADVSWCDELHVLHGAASIREELHLPGGRTLAFRISPMSFFQTNTLATENLYGAIRQWIAAAPPRVLYDLYGGMGGIAMSGADLVDRVISVENVEAASVDGRANVARNGVENVTFITEKVEVYLRAARDAGGLEAGAGVVVDPPRAGMHPKAIKRLLELGPARVLYVSCNPKIFVQEWKALSERYRIESAQGFDLFPHTPHVELMVSLVPRES